MGPVAPVFRTGPSSISIFTQKTIVMSKVYKKLASEVDCFSDFNFVIFATFKTSVLLIDSGRLKLDSGMCCEIIKV